MEFITDEDYVHTKRVCKDFEIKSYKNIMIYMFKTIHYCQLMYLRTLKICLETYLLDPAKFLSVPGLTRLAAIKKTKAKLDLLTDIDMLLMVEKGIRRRIRHSIYQYAKANNRYVKYHDKNKELSYIQYWDINNLYGCGNVPKTSSKKF